MSPKSAVFENQFLMNRIFEAEKIVNDAMSPVERTVLFRDEELSDEFDADIWLTSEVHQPIRAYKIRGAYNFMDRLSPKDREKGVFTASAGNHAQGIALSGNRLGVKTSIYMPETTPELKINRVAELGGDTTTIVLTGRTFDECLAASQKDCKTAKGVFAPPFDDILVVAGQGTWGLEVARELPDIDIVFMPVGGMGLFAGSGTAIKHFNKNVDLIGVEPDEASSLMHAKRHDRAVALETPISTRTDGAAVARVGHLPFILASHLVDAIIPVSDRETDIATTYLWERPINSIKVELAGSLAVAALNRAQHTIRGKRVLCMLTGGNLSPERYQSEIKIENFQGLKASK